MIEVKANTTDHRTEVKAKVEADFFEYGAEVLAIIQSLMGALKKDDIRLHAAVLKAIADEPKILLGEDTPADEAKAELDLAKLMSKAIIKKGVN